MSNLSIWQFIPKQVAIATMVWGPLGETGRFEEASPKQSTGESFCYTMPVLQIIVIKIKTVFNDYAPLTCISSDVELLTPANVLCSRKITSCFSPAWRQSRRS